MKLGLVSMILLAIAFDSSAAQHAPESTSMAEAICRDSSHFETCFNWGHDDCLSHAKSALDECFSVMDAPPSDPDKAGLWGIAWGACAEVWMKRFLPANSSCAEYFETREKDWRSSEFYAGFEKPKSRTASASDSVFWIQFAITLGFGLALPFALAWRRWSKNPPEKFPKAFSQKLIFASWGGLFLAIIVQAASGIFALGVRTHGDNPMATGGLTMALLALIPSYWVGLFAIYRVKRSQNKVA